MKLLDDLLKKFRKYKSEHGFSCDVCNREIFDYPHHRLCKDCERGLPFNDTGSCPLCGRKTRSNGLCLNCKDTKPRFDKGFSPFCYEERGASIVNRFKNGERYLAYLLAEEMIKTLSNGLEEELVNPVICFVPATEQSKKERGYNQAEELAEIFAEKTGIEYIPDLLQKTRETRAQKRMTAMERIENVSGAYRVHKRVECREKTVILIDDVMTTGSTGTECARILKNAGASKVIFVTAASLQERK